MKRSEVTRDESDDILESPIVVEFDRMIFLVILWQNVNASSLTRPIWRWRRS